MVPDKPVGVGKYLLELIKNINSLPRSFELNLYTRQNDFDRWNAVVGHKDVLKNKDVLNNKVVVHNIVPSNKAIRVGYENLILGRIVNSSNIFHSPHYSVPLNLKIPLIVNIHDLIFFENSTYHQFAKAVYFRSQIKQAIKKADVIICGTEYIKQKIQKRFNPKGQIEVVPYGVNIHEFEPDEIKSVEDQALLTQLKIVKPYILYVGTIEPRKKVDDLIKAYRMLVETKKIDSKMSLILVGKYGWKYDSVKELIENNKVGSVVHLGYIPQKYIGPLMRESVCVVYPSETEGFGLPVLEAMAAKTVVVTTSNSVMEYFAKDAGYYFESGNLEDLASTIEKTFVNGDRNDRILAGYETAKQFGWENSAKLHLALYEKMLT